MLGMIKASSFKSRRKELENIIEVLQLMDIEITYRREPLFKTFCKTSSDRSCWFAKALDICGKELKNRKSLKEAWRISTMSLNEECPLDDDDKSILADLISALGKSDTEGQKKLLESTVSKLKINLNKASVIEHNQGKMYTALGTAAGIITVILLF